MDGNYRITAAGAQGGDNGGTGAIIEGSFALTMGQKLWILVGQQGLTASHSYSCPSGFGTYGGGGGGSFVATGTALSSTTQMIAAAGGHGANTGNCDRYVGPNGSTATGDGYGETSGNDKGACSGGFYSDGSCGTSHTQDDRAFRNGGIGGGDYGTDPADGGFGGASGTYWNGSGAGGGYEGSSGTDSPSSAPSALPAKSYNTGTDQSNTTGNTGHGYVTIEYLD